MQTYHYPFYTKQQGTFSSKFTIESNDVAIKAEIKVLQKIKNVKDYVTWLSQYNRMTFEPLVTFTSPECQPVVDLANTLSTLTDKFLTKDIALNWKAREVLQTLYNMKWLTLTADQLYAIKD